MQLQQQILWFSDALFYVRTTWQLTFRTNAGPLARWCWLQQSSERKAVSGNNFKPWTTPNLCIIPLPLDPNDTKHTKKTCTQSTKNPVRRERTTEDIRGNSIHSDTGVVMWSARVGHSRVQRETRPAPEDQEICMAPRIKGRQGDATGSEGHKFGQALSQDKMLLGSVRIQYLEHLQRYPIFFKNMVFFNYKKDIRRKKKVISNSFQ